ncbi:MAG: hypothetical protein C6P35_03395 [Cohnella sp.]|uniref:hypothetical protein n=1 Tax=Cohnella sp. TaxID=1883426 RepID=UPI000E3B3441|nr:hypothetical protein [Cohnella sp.]REK68027.1 MAG: hypothetical protein C6P35_03395 [Cohnella sp.]
MKYLIDSGDISLYFGILPDHLSLDRFGFDWCIFEANSTDDAWEQASAYAAGTHPQQSEISRMADDIRTLYSQDSKAAWDLFRNKFPSSPRPITLKLEAIGDDARQFYKDLSRNPLLKETIFGNDDRNPFSRPWVAEITGKDPKYKFRRVFLRGRKDYSEANKKGSRGVYYYYELYPGKIYQINDRISWKVTRRYFARVIDGNLVEIEESEVEECLRENLE